MGGKYVTGREAIELTVTLLKGTDVRFQISASVESGATPTISAWFRYGYLFIRVDVDTQTYSDEVELVITSSTRIFGGVTTGDKFQSQTTDNVKVFTDISPYQCIYKYFSSPDVESITNFICCSTIGITRAGTGTDRDLPLCEYTI